VTGRGRTRPTVFRASYADAFQARAAARFAAETLGKHRAALFFDPGDDYSAALSQAFSTEFAAQGGQIVYQFAYPPADTDFTSALPAAVEAGAEIIYLPAPADVANRVAGQRRQLSQSEQLTLLGSDSWDAPELDLAAAESSYFTRHFFLDEHRPATQAWADAYKAAYAVAPDTLAALGYDAASILMEAIEEAGTAEVKPVAEILAQGQFEAITGPIRFDGQHNPVKPVPIVQVKEGKIILAGYVGQEK
jgi:branched-chain amino acid transport system substrate-binding protein